MPAIGAGGKGGFFVFVFESISGPSGEPCGVVSLLGRGGRNKIKRTFFDAPNNPPGRNFYFISIFFKAAPTRETKYVTLHTLASAFRILKQNMLRSTRLPPPSLFYGVTFFRKLSAQKATLNTLASACLILWSNIISKKFRPFLKGS